MSPTSRHGGYGVRATGATRREMCRTAARNVRDVLQGRRPENLVNPEVADRIAADATTD